MTAARRRRKRPGWIRRKLGRWAWRRVHRWAADVRARAKKTLAPRVIHPSAKERSWQRQFPDPRRPEPLEMRPQEEWDEEWEALFHNGWHVEFTVDSFDRKADLREAAYEAGVRRHGEIVRSLQIVNIDPRNDLAERARRRGMT